MNGLARPKKNDSDNFFNKFKTIPVQVQLRSLPIYEFILL